MGFKSAVKRYYHLSKPGIIYGNLLTATAGYLYGSQFSIRLLVLGGLLLGIALVIAGACATNNYLDRDIDAKMERTNKRSLVNGNLTPKQALIYAFAATTLGLVILAVTQNSLTVGLVAFAWFAYVILYGYSKRFTVHGTLIGCISGSLPLIAGYSATVGRLDITASLLFLLMTAWQMAHFYGIALYRLKDYKSAKIPVMPAVYGAWTTQLQALGYIVVFVGIAIIMIMTNRLHLLTGALLAGVGCIWLIRALRSLPDLSATDWGRKTFLFSLIVIFGLSTMLSIDPLLP